jgi:hypothetical protein
MLTAIRSADSFRWPHQLRPVGQRFHARLQVSFDVIESDTAQPQGSFLFAPRLSNDHDGLGAIEHCARPGGVLPAESDVDAAGQDLFQILVQRGALASIENRIVGEVRRRVGLVGRDETMNSSFNLGRRAQFKRC